jgi:hypothetical protein
MKRSIFCILLALAGASSAEQPAVDKDFLRVIPVAETDEAKAAAAKATRDAAKSSHARMSARLDAARYLVRPFLVADKQERTVQLWAGATGMKAGEPTEFFVIGPESGNDYESISVAYAKPSHVHEALVFIGLKPGWPVDPGRLRFWPKGDRVIMNAQVMDPDGALRDQRMEEYIIDVSTGQDMAIDGLVFAGSMMVDDPGGSGKKVYGADVFGPTAIVSDYNEVNTVLDLPRQGSKGEVYGNHVCNATWAMDTGHPMMIVLRPHATLSAINDLRLDLAYAEGQVRYQLRRADGSALHEDTSFPAMLSALEKVPEAFGTVHFAPELPLEKVVDICGQLEKIETVGGLRINPPPEGHVYYKTFLPQLAWLQRDKRPGQPFELYVRKKGEATTYELILAEEKYGDDIVPEIIPHSYPAASTDELLSLIKEHGEGVQTLFLLVESSLAYGELLKLLQPHLERFPVVYVFQL